MGGISGGPEAEHRTSTPISMQAWVDSMGSGRERRLATPLLAVMLIWSWILVELRLSHRLRKRTDRSVMSDTIP